MGFYLDDTPRRDAAYVNLHRGSQTSGRFAAVDQIFPHELLHALVRQLAGEAPDGGANQVHAIGVRTDPLVAFNEGFFRTQSSPSVGEVARRVGQATSQTD